LFDQLGHSVGAIAIGASDLSLIPLLNGSSGYGWALLGYGSGLVAAYVVGFVATLLFGVSESVRADLEAQSATSADNPVAPDAPVYVPLTPTQP
jgi:PTS system sucrose-specific IIC component